jgi:hypothetical protein
MTTGEITRLAEHQLQALPACAAKGLLSEC